MYTSNERLPILRAKAVKMVRSGKTTREVAKYFGYSQSVIVKWCKKVEGKEQFDRIETLSSRPNNSPKRISKEIEAKILKTRIENKRCAEVVKSILDKEDVNVSLRTIKRVINRYGLVKKRSLWKKKRIYPPRPDILSPGDLIQIDTVHIINKDNRKIYIYTAIDIYSRYAYASLSDRANTYSSIKFFKEVNRYFKFNIKNIQTDNGPEFGKYFTDYLNRNNITHRHIHPRSPNENGHLERFNRTIQEEPEKQYLSILLQKDIKKYLDYYNNKRHHLGINCKTPNQMLK